MFKHSICVTNYKLKYKFNCQIKFGIIKNKNVMTCLMFFITIRKRKDAKVQARLPWVANLAWKV